MPPVSLVVGEPIESQQEGHRWSSARAPESVRERIEAAAEWVASFQRLVSCFCPVFSFFLSFCLPFFLSFCLPFFSLLSSPFHIFFPHWCTWIINTIQSSETAEKRGYRIVSSQQLSRDLTQKRKAFRDRRKDLRGDRDVPFGIWQKNKPGMIWRDPLDFQICDEMFVSVNRFSHFVFGGIGTIEYITEAHRIVFGCCTAVARAEIGCAWWKLVALSPFHTQPEENTIWPGLYM